MAMIIQSHLGELAALAAAICWTLNAIAFEIAGRKTGSLSVSYLRLFVAFFLISISSFISRGLLFPTDAHGSTWLWLLISGLLGFILGDMFLFEAFVLIGSRISLLIMSAAPPLTALIGFILMGEEISWLNALGMALTMAGISLVILGREQAKKKISLNLPLKGVLYACLGALGQALGLIFSKLGMGDYHVMASTQIRLIAALIGYTLLVSYRQKWPEIKAAFQHRDAIKNIAIGAVLGPFIGVTFSLVALKHTASGIVSSITSISPVLIIPLSILVFNERISGREILGAFLSISGVVILFL